MDMVRMDRVGWAVYMAEDRTVAVVEQKRSSPRKSYAAITSIGSHCPFSTSFP